MEIIMFLFIAFCILRATAGNTSLAVKEDNLLDDYIKGILKKYDKNQYIINNKLMKKKLIMYIIFAVISLVSISYFFIYHRNLLVVIFIEIVALIVTIRIVKKVSIFSEIKKQIKASPDDNMEYIIAGIIEDATSSRFTKTKFIGLGIILLSFILPLYIFSKPHMIFEKEANGYAVRYYTYSLFNRESEIVIPDTYKGEPVVGIRGNVFQNLNIEKVTIPSTITYIRGHAFDSTEISEINLPEGLTYVGAYAFADTNLKSLIFPDTVTEIGGGVCSNCKSLKELKLSNNITEVRGNSFENTLIEAVEIPEGVTRIGGHAFHGCSFLRNVTLPYSLKEIGSSAFRECYNLTEIYIPRHIFVNERAFKNTPVTIYYK